VSLDAQLSPRGPQPIRFIAIPFPPKAEALCTNFARPLTFKAQILVCLAHSLESLRQPSARQVRAAIRGLATGVRVLLLIRVLRVPSKAFHLPLQLLRFAAQPFLLPALVDGLAGAWLLRGQFVLSAREFVESLQGLLDFLAAGLCRVDHDHATPAVFGEVLAEAKARRAMKVRYESIDHRLGHEVQTREGGWQRRIEEAPNGGGTYSSRRRRISSTLMRSGSA
jgi:hypothetical protein